jgi:hypothetical protein
MGLFDSLYINCPKCNYLIEFQSKANDWPSMEVYKEDDCPDVIKMDIVDNIEDCRHCKSKVQAKLVVRPEITFEVIKDEKK